MRSPAEKKRLLWLLILIFFFFANLTLLAVLVIQNLSSAKPAPTSAPAAASQR